MRSLYLILFLLGSSFVSVAQDIEFTYDAAGNQTFKGVIVMSRPAQQEEIDEIKEEPEPSDFLTSSVAPEIQYYPNPLKDRLYLQWQNTELKTVQKLELYSLTGKLISEQDLTADTEQTVIDFGFQPIGMYLIMVYYSDSTTKELKVIKK